MNQQALLMYMLYSSIVAMRCHPRNSLPDLGEVERCLDVAEMAIVVFARRAQSHQEAEVQ